MLMNKEIIIEFCNKAKQAIDWNYDLSSGYQEMMREIDDYLEKIIEDVSK